MTLCLDLPEYEAVDSNDVNTERRFICELPSRNTTESNMRHRRHLAHAIPLLFLPMAVMADGQDDLAKQLANPIALNTESTYDWEGEQWSVPINFTVSQLLKTGNQIGSGVGYWADAPSNGPEG